VQLARRLRRRRRGRLLVLELARERLQLLA
jgi:hypothetical protein